MVVDYHYLAGARVNQSVVPGYASVQSRPGKTECFVVQYCSVALPMSQ